MADKAVADNKIITPRETSGVTETLRHTDVPGTTKPRSSLKRQDDTLHRIVVVGGGAGGSSSHAARRQARQRSRPRSR